MSPSSSLSPALLSFGGRAPAAVPSPPSGLIDAIDVSSAQSLDIGSLLDSFKPDHVIVKLYQTVELSGKGARYPIAQAQAARDRGCTVGGYVWLYAGIDGAKQVADALATAQRAGIELGERNPLWLDCELYEADGSSPGLNVISQAVKACQDQGVAVGIYTGKYWWRDQTGDSHAFAALPLWQANYDGNAILEAPGFGGWQSQAGHQWTSTPIDRSVFRAEFATP
jgi:hypothetical protein